MQPHLRHLYAYLYENGFIRELAGIPEQHLAIFSHDVLERIRRGDPGWEQMVPEAVAAIIRRQRLFNCAG